MRDLMILGALFFLIPMALRSPLSAYLMWGWTALVALDDYMFGFMAGMRLNLLFAIISLALLLLHSRKLEGCWEFNRTNTLLVVWLVHGVLSASFAYPDMPTNWLYFEKFAKGVLFVLVMPFVIVRRYQIHALVVALCLAVSFHGLIDGLKVFASGGGHIVSGLAKFGDNNLFAVTIIMSVPLLIYIYKQSVHRLAKVASAAGIVLVIAAVLGTRSRGGLLSLAGMGGWLVLVSKKKILSLMLVATTTLAILIYAPSDWLSRMDTIKAANEDSSFLSRVEAWQVSSAIALQNPVLGGGFHAIENASTWDRFRGDKGLLWFTPSFDHSNTILRAAHSAYFEVLGDRGFVGLIIYIAILVNILLTAKQVKRYAKIIGLEAKWAVDLSNAISASTIAFIVGTGGVSLAYSELIYILAGLSEVLKKYMACKYKIMII